jgi:hypothetical protein
MKYILLFCGTRDDPRPKLAPEAVEATHAEIGDWFRRHASAVRSTYQLQGPDTATTVLNGAGPTAVVKDGPFLEGKELIGGYCVIDVADLDEALAMARTWPGRTWAVEVRPLIDRELPPELDVR